MKNLALLNKIIAVDFDGTLCENAWPDIGAPNESLIIFLKEEKSRGSKLILWTCRIGENLDAAVTWCKQRELIFDAVNENLPETILFFGGDTRKVFAHEYIDDRSYIFSWRKENNNGNVRLGEERS